MKITELTNDSGNTVLPVKLHFEEGLFSSTF